MWTGKSGKTSEPSLLSGCLPYTKLTVVFFFFSLATGARHQHRGPRAGGKKIVAKQSHQRRENLFSTTVPDNDTALHALPTEASRDHRTEEEIDAILPWVCWFDFLTLPFYFLTFFPGCSDCGKLPISSA